MAEVDSENEHVVPSFEQPDWDHGVYCKLPLVEHGQDPGHHAKDDEADDRGGNPGVVDATKLETKEEHKSASNDE